MDSVYAFRIGKMCLLSEQNFKWRDSGLLDTRTLTARAQERFPFHVCFRYFSRGDFVVASLASRDWNSVCFLSRTPQAISEGWVLTKYMYEVPVKSYTHFLPYIARTVDIESYRKESHIIFLSTRSRSYCLFRCPFARTIVFCTKVWADWLWLRHQNAPMRCVSPLSFLQYQICYPQFHWTARRGSFALLPFELLQIIETNHVLFHWKL